MPKWLQIIAIGRRPQFTVVRIVILVAAIFLLRAYVFLPIRISGASMMPNYPVTGINCVNRLAYRWHPPQRGDVVAIRMAGEHMMLMKRIIGLPGETVEFIGGQLYVDGKALSEPYVKFPCNWDRPPETLTSNQFFVVGDNRAMRIEDHMHGKAERERIIGRIML